VDDLAVSMDRLARNRSPVEAIPLPPLPSFSNDSLQPIHRAIAELRDLSLLTDTQRHERAQQIREQQKLAEIRHAILCIERRQWSQAQQILRNLEGLFPGDHAVARTQDDFERARSSAEAQAMSVAEGNIESEMSLGHWDQALAAANELAANFPGNAQAINMLTRVQREQSIFTETTVSRWLDEIRHSTERREWRKALASSQRLLEKFPAHPKSERIRLQFKTIQDNAEIEERQQQEVRIGELIRSRRFGEAIQLGEDLLHRFPMSPQAEAMEKLLPRIKQLAIEAAQPPVGPLGTVRDSQHAP
jgi:tetratricopeptide (TPR) repeat protein